MSDEQTVSIDGVDYNPADFTPEQVQLINHVSDLDGQIRRVAMQMEQAQVARSHFMAQLKETLNDDKE